MSENNGANDPNRHPSRVPALPPFPEFQASTQKFQRMPDGETFRVVQFGAIETAKPTHIYIGLGVMMQLVGERMVEQSKHVQAGWADRWNAYRLAAEGTQVDLGNGVIKFDGKDNLNAPKRPGE